MAAAVTVPAIYTVYTAFIGAGGVAIGAIVSTLSDWGKDRRAEKRGQKADQRAIARERATRREETSWKWYESRATFERDTALELQQELYLYARAFTSTRVADEMHYRKSGVWGQAQLPEDVSEDFRLRTVAINRLRVRLFDSALRDRVEEYQKLCNRAVMQHGDAGDAAKKARRTAGDLEAKSGPIFESINEQLGSTIRKAFEALDPYQVPELPQFPPAVEPPN